MFGASAKVLPKREGRAQTQANDDMVMGCFFAELRQRSSALPFSASLLVSA